MCPAGGVEMGWQLAMRSKNIYGPYEARKVMAQGKTKINGPHQGAWVHTSQDEDWFLHFNDKDGDGCGEPYLTYRMPKSASKVKMNPQESDELNAQS